MFRSSSCSRSANNCLAGHGWWLAVAAGTYLGALLCYQAAVSAAAAYGQAIETAFDLHRCDLLKALHLPLPADLASERAANQRLSRFLTQPTEYVIALSADPAGPDNITYQHESASQAGTVTAPSQTIQRDAGFWHSLSRRRP